MDEREETIGTVLSMVPALYEVDRPAVAEALGITLKKYGRLFYSILT